MCSWIVLDLICLGQKSPSINLILNLACNMGFKKDKTVR